jgi:hypothetical protein
MWKWNIRPRLATLGWTLSALAIVAACGRSQPTQAFTGIPAPDTTFFAPPASIDASGQTDVTAALNQFLASVPESSVVTLPVGARYRAEGVVRLIGKTNLTIEGNGALIFAETDGSDVTPPEDLGHLWPRARSHVEITSSRNIVIRNLMVRGANPNAGSEKGAYVSAFEGQHGFDVRAVDGLLLDRVTVTDTYGDLLYIAGLQGEVSRNIRVTNSHLERSGRQGIAITGGENVLVEDSYVGEVARTIIDLEPNTASGRAWNIVLRRNTFGPCRHLLLSAGGRGPGVGEVELSNNVLQGMQIKVAVGASDGARRGPFRIIGNVSDTRLGTPVAAMRFHRSDGVTVLNNVQPMVVARSMTGVSAVESCDVVVQENDFLNAALQAEVEPYSCPASS